MENVGILCVFQVFHDEKPKQKSHTAPKSIDTEVSYIRPYNRSGSRKTDIQHSIPSQTRKAPPFPAKPFAPQVQAASSWVSL